MTIGIQDTIGGTGSLTFTMEVDATWSANARARSAYTGELFNIGGYNRSFDIYAQSAFYDDTLNGTNGNDALFMSTLASKAKDLNGTAVATSAHFTSVEFFNLLGGNDVLDLSSSSATNGSTFGSIAEVDGGEGNDVILGGLDSDKLSGGNGNDILHGGVAVIDPIERRSNSLDGGVGNDILQTGVAGDRLTGGPGNDLFVSDMGQRTSTTYPGASLSNFDTIEDFDQNGDDRIDLRAYGVTNINTFLATNVADLFGFATNIDLTPFGGQDLLVLGQSPSSFDAGDFLI